MGTQITRDRPQVTQMVSALHLIGWKGGTSFLDQSKGVKGSSRKTKAFLTKRDTPRMPLELIYRWRFFRAMYRIQLKGILQGLKISLSWCGIKRRHLHIRTVELPRNCLYCTSILCISFTSNHLRQRVNLNNCVLITCGSLALKKLWWKLSWKFPKQHVNTFPLKLWTRLFIGIPRPLILVTLVPFRSYSKKKTKKQSKQVLYNKEVS